MRVVNLDCSLQVSVARGNYVTNHGLLKSTFPSGHRLSARLRKNSNERM